MKKIFLVVMCACMWCAPMTAARSIYGVKSAPGDPSSAPGYLFACREDGTQMSLVGLLTVAGAPVDIDGLAMNASDELFGFELTPTGSRLVSIDRETAAATRIGTQLAGRTIRGGAFDTSGALWALDVNAGRLLTIDVSDAGVVEVIPLTLGGSPLIPDPACDIAFDADGGAWVSNGDDLFSLEITTGRLQFASLMTGMRTAGLCASIHAIGDDHLFYADSGQQLDSGWVRTRHGFEVLRLYRNIAPVISTGVADLAGRITPDPMRCAGDADGDAAVTFSDLNLILAFWGTAVEPGTGADVTGDGLVNFADINLMLDAWGTACE